MKCLVDPCNILLSLTHMHSAVALRSNTFQTWPLLVTAQSSKIISSASRYLQLKLINLPGDVSLKFQPWICNTVILVQPNVINLTNLTKPVNEVVQLLLLQFKGGIFQFSINWNLFKLNWNKLLLNWVIHPQWSLNNSLYKKLKLINQKSLVWIELYSSCT